MWCYVIIFINLKVVKYYSLKYYISLSTRTQLYRCVVICFIESVDTMTFWKHLQRETCYITFSNDRPRGAPLAAIITLFLETMQGSIWAIHIWNNYQNKTMILGHAETFFCKRISDFLFVCVHCDWWLKCSIIQGLIGQLCQNRCGVPWKYVLI